MAHEWQQRPQNEDGEYDGYFWVHVDREDIDIFRVVRVTPPEVASYAQVHSCGEKTPLPEWQKLHALWWGPITEPERPSAP